MRRAVGVLLLCLVACSAFAQSPAAPTNINVNAAKVTAAGGACTTTVSATLSALVAGIASTTAPGGVLCVNNGSITVTSGITVNRAITIRPTNTNGVTLTNNANDNIFTITEQTAGNIEIGSFVFEGGSTLGTTGAHQIRIVAGTTGAKPVFINSPIFHTNDNAVGAMRVETNQGIAWGGTCDYSATAPLDSKGQATDAECFQFKLTGQGATWNAVSKWGADDTTGTANFYVEDWTFNYVRLQAYDCDDNARINLRHSAFKQSGGTSHGSDTSVDGCRQADLNHNTFTFTDFGDNDGHLTQNVDYLILPRGGTWSIWANVIPDVHSSAWNDKTEIKVEIQNLRRNAGNTACYHAGWPSPHQFGTGGNGTSQVSEPVYFWANTGAGDYNSPGLADFDPDQCGGGPPITDYVQANRDFFTNTTRPGYVEKTYPHPLRGGR